MKNLLSLLVLIICGACGGQTGSGGTEDPVEAVDPSSPSTPSEPGKTCGEQAFAINRAVPDVLIILDGSGSMAEGAPPLWNTSRSAIYDITSAMDQQIWFGLMVFPASTATCSIWDEYLSCAAPAAPLVPVGPGKAAIIKSTLSSAKACGGTPTAAVLAKARQYLQTGLPANGHARAVLLATDGAPNCNTSLNPSTCTCSFGTTGQCDSADNCLDDQLTYKALDELCAAGIKTYVIGLGGSTVLTGVLGAMAQHGCTGNAYAANDPSSVKAAFQTITSGIASCAFEVECSKVQNPYLVNFYFDGKVVPRTPSKQSGWEWTTQCQGGTGKGVVEFFGADCEAVKASTVKVISAKFGCATKID